jgi:hypothetical protein
MSTAFSPCVRTPFPNSFPDGRLNFSLVQIRFCGWPIWTAHEAFTDPESFWKRLSNEGHGFSRAVKLRANDGFSR